MAPAMPGAWLSSHESHDSYWSHGTYGSYGTYTKLYSASQKLSTSLSSRVTGLAGRLFKKVLP